MKSARQIVSQLLACAGITVNGQAPWDIQVHDERFFRRVLRFKNLGLGESYMEGWWDCRRLDVMMHRLLAGGIEEKVRGELRYLVHFLPGLLFNLQSRERSRKAVRRHYDIGNDLFLSFLDPYNQYSCGFFEGTDDLDRAQLNKLALICRKLNLSPRDQVLDIGCGWGGLAKYVGEQIGCPVTAVNISLEQLDYARRFCDNAAVTLKECDYRTVRGRFDKIVSVGMFEHVGVKNYRIFMKTVHRCLDGSGIFLLHTIGRNVSGNSCEPWITQYIFPNCVLPSPVQIARAVEGLFVIEDWHNLCAHYDKTLMAWNDRFQRAWPARLKEKFDPVFKRMWEYYLLSCAGAFRARTIHVWQIVMTKDGTGTPAPECRPAAFPAPVEVEEVS
jgi:cyclopropane-fatty-acyl-phospholipid synthase